MSKQITEDYCSFETAKLLKEKGFDERCGTAYTTTEGYPIRVMGATYSLERNSDYDDFHYSMPSQSVALKWLREVKKIHISLYAVLGPTEEGCIPEKITYTYNILDASKPFCLFDEYDECYTNPPQLNSYEEAVEVAIKYTLENLI